MRTPRIASLVLALVAAGFAPSVVRAHEHWLAPSVFRADSGTTVAIGVQVGDGMCGPAKTYRADRTVKFRSKARRTLDMAPFATAGDSAWARFTPVDRGGFMVSWESNFAFLKLDGEKFDAYLVAEGLDGPLAARRAARDTTAARERYRRCSKVWITGSDADPQRACFAIGMPLELVPTRLPGADSLLGMRVLFMGSPLPGALVRAWRAALGEAGSPKPCLVDSAGPPTVWEGRTGDDGIAWVPCATPGQWLIGAAHMVKSADPKEADWESNWASYGFARFPGDPH